MPQAVEHQLCLSGPLWLCSSQSDVEFHLLSGKDQPAKCRSSWFLLAALLGVTVAACIDGWLFPASGANAEQDTLEGLGVWGGG